jgi:DNA-binding transcriptional MerR regulator
MGKQRAGEQGERIYHIQEIQQHHRRILELRALGLQISDIAREVGMTPQQVGNVVNSPISRKRLSEMQSAQEQRSIEARGRLQEMMPRAIEVLNDILEDPEQIIPIHTRLKAATEVLSRGGVGPESVIKGEVIHAHLTLDEIEQIKARAKETLGQIRMAEAS